MASYDNVQPVLILCNGEEILTFFPSPRREELRPGSLAVLPRPPAHRSPLHVLLHAVPRVPGGAARPHRGPRHVHHRLFPPQHLKKEVRRDAGHPVPIRDLPSSGDRRRKRLQIRGQYAVAVFGIFPVRGDRVGVRGGEVRGRR